MRDKFLEDFAKGFITCLIAVVGFGFITYNEVEHRGYKEGYKAGVHEGKCFMLREVLMLDVEKGICNE